MTAKELNTYIDKVLGNSIRCLLPSYWWKRILTLIVGYVESIHELLDSKITVVDTSLSDVTIDVSKVINIIKKTSYVTITTSSEGSAKVYADGKAIDIPAGETVKVFCGDSFHAISPTGGGNSDNLETILSIDTSMMITSWYKSMENMFMWCKNISSLDVSHFDTSRVKNMDSMFNDCFYLTSLDVSNFDTSNVTDMNTMFYDCMALTSLDVSNFDTSNVTDMRGMFFNCVALTSLDVSNFDTSNVTDMNSMFYGCMALTSLDVSNFDTSNVTDMRGMFLNCWALTSLDVSNFDTSNVTDMNSMFYNCRALTSLDVSNFDTSNVTDMSYMFDDCWALTSLDVSNFDTSNVTDMSNMFYGCSSLVTLTLGADFFKVKSLDTPLDFSSLANWSSESAIPSLVTNSYDRTANGLANITLKLRTNTYAYLTDEHKATLTAKGYDVVSA